MNIYEYIAKDQATNKEVRAEVQADSEKSAAKLIMNQGLVPISIVPKGEKRLFKAKGRIKPKDKVLFSRQLSTLINAGLPLTQSLRTVQEQTSNKELASVISEIISDVEAGMALAKALEQHPRVFNTVFVSLVAAGEASGTLDDALERIANQQEKDAEVVSKVRGALVYPIIVLVVIGAVIIFMLTSVLPQVELLYKDLNQSLPFITAVMLSISKFITKFWWLLIIIAVGSGFMLKRWVETDAGRSAMDSLKMNVPVFGKLFMKMYMARFARTGQTLMTTGVPMLQMMHITGRAVNNVHIKNALDKASEKVKGGKALSDSISDDPNFLPLVPQMIHIGEQSGSIDTMMGKVASFYENELDNEIKAISTTIEPILMVVLAVVAGLMVGAILLPVYGLVGTSVV